MLNDVHPFIVPTGDAGFLKAVAKATASATGRAVLPLLLPLVLLALWQAGVSAGRLETTIFPAPADVVAKLSELVSDNVLLPEFVSTARRIVLGFVIGAALGIALGAAAGYSRFSERLVDATVQGLRAVPAVAWIPFLILWLGIEDRPKIGLVTIATFFPLYVNTFSGIRSTDQKLIELAQAYRLSRATVLRRILLPSALPQIFVGLRLAAGISWIAATFSEILVGNEGLGVLLNDGRSLQQPELTVAIMLVLALSGKATDAGIRAVERRSTRWRSTYDGETAARSESGARREGGVVWESR